MRGIAKHKCRKNKNETNTKHINHNNVTCQISLISVVRATLVILVRIWQFRRGTTTIPVNLWTQATFPGNVRVRLRPSLAMTTFCRFCNDMALPMSSSIYRLPPHQKWWEVMFLPASVNIQEYMSVNNFLAPTQVQLSQNFVSHTLVHTGRGD